MIQIYPAGHFQPPAGTKWSRPLTFVSFNVSSTIFPHNPWDIFLIIFVNSMISSMYVQERQCSVFIITKRGNHSFFKLSSAHSSHLQHTYTHTQYEDVSWWRTFIWDKLDFKSSSVLITFVTLTGLPNLLRSSFLPYKQD